MKDDIYDTCVVLFANIHMLYLSRFTMSSTALNCIKSKQLGMNAEANE